MLNNTLRTALTACLALLLTISAFAQHSITSARLTGPAQAQLTQSGGSQILIDFYADNIFRLLADSAGKGFRPPAAKPAAEILVTNPRTPVGKITLSGSPSQGSVTITSPAISIKFNTAAGTFTVYNKAGHVILAAAQPLKLQASQSYITLTQQPGEYFYGGGVQNGRFSHKGKAIAIENQNNWTDGGVASPNPFYWSTAGYGLMWYTFKKGRYDFGSADASLVSLTHNTPYVDVFIMCSPTPRGILNSYFQLTGQPVLLPKAAFYQGHLNAYNRDYWKEDPKGILFEDGKHYSESQKDNGGIKESLNGERNNYQFSARAVIDRYKRADMPLGWLLANDGYGAGYGQTGTLDSNILNLKNLVQYAAKHNVLVGLWAQSDLHPKAGVSPLLQRDIVKEIGTAGVRVLKTDVAWVGAGYSFGLAGVADVANTTIKYGNNARPFIISLDGWAGTQRYASIWSGDQTGGEWEYIRFHIPTFIGSGLSGNPNITSDVDGIFGGKNIPVNVREYQWKTFTPMQLNMDGWGSQPKYPQALGEPATSINRSYLKLKAALMPYTYSIAKTATHGLPIIRPMFTEEANAYTLGSATKYQYMYGPYMLVAPVYQNTRADSVGNDIRHGIYLPRGLWYDYVSGARYTGGAVYNYVQAPLKKLPVFIKAGAIIPVTLPGNNPAEIPSGQRFYDLYPYGNTAFTEYDDDGSTIAYKNGGAVTTLIKSSLSGRKATVTVLPAQGNFNGFQPKKTTTLMFNVSSRPAVIQAFVNNKAVKLRPVTSMQQLRAGNNVYYYNTKELFNNYATNAAAAAKITMPRNPKLYIKLAAADVTKTTIRASVYPYVFNISNGYLVKSGVAPVPQHAAVPATKATAFTLSPVWQQAPGADFYEINFNGMRYTHITDSTFTFDGLQPDTKYSMQLRAVNRSNASQWLTLSGTTKRNPLEYAIKGITATATIPSQEGEELFNMVDFQDATAWHSDYEKKADSFDIQLDLHSTNQLTKLQYLPRLSGYNGILSKGTVYYALKPGAWVQAGTFSWPRNNQPQEFAFTGQPTARYIKIHVAESVGKYGSGREFYVFKVPGSQSVIPGDINNDGKIDANDLTSYTNYTGLRKGDADFEGYISNGDINGNNLIDAYDISHVTTRLNGGVGAAADTLVSGTLQLRADKAQYTTGQLVTITVSGQNLKDVNALSFALPYDPADYDFVRVTPLNMQGMDNLTYDRLHTSGAKALYPTFVNQGSKPLLSGSGPLFTITLRAKRNLRFNLKAADGLLVSPALTTSSF